VSPPPGRARRPRPGGDAAPLPPHARLRLDRHLARGDRAGNGERVRHLPRPPASPQHPRRHPGRGTGRRGARAARLPLRRPPADDARPRDARPGHVPGLVERFPLAPHRARRRASLHAARGAREPRGRARAGHGAGDGRRGPHRAARGRAVPGAPALVRGRHHQRRRQGVRGVRRAALVVLLAAALAKAVTTVADTPAEKLVPLDDFETSEGWTVAPSPGTRAELVSEHDDGGSALRLDYDLANSSGFVILSKQVRLTLPENFAFTFRLRGEAPRGTLEFKVVDTDGNVWWRRWPNFAFPLAWQPMVVRRSRLAFAWGPVGGGGPRAARAMEIAVSGGKAGPGTLWIDDLALEPREPAAPDDVLPHVEASSFRPGFEAGKAVDASPATQWKSEAVA